MFQKYFRGSWGSRKVELLSEKFRKNSEKSQTSADISKILIFLWVVKKLFFNWPTAGKQVKVWSQNLKLWVIANTKRTASVSTRQVELYGKIGNPQVSLRDKVIFFFYKEVTECWRSGDSCYSEIGSFASSKYDLCHTIWTLIKSIEFVWQITLFERAHCSKLPSPCVCTGAKILPCLYKKHASAIWCMVTHQNLPGTFFISIFNSS